MTSPTTPARQLEIAAHWLKEAAITLTATKGDRSLRDSLVRVADHCLTVARREEKK